MTLLLLGKVLRREAKVGVATAVPDRRGPQDVAELVGLERERDLRAACDRERPLGEERLDAFLEIGRFTGPFLLDQLALGGGRGDLHGRGWQLGRRCRQPRACRL